MTPVSLPQSISSTRWSKAESWFGIIACCIASFFAAWIFQLEWNHPTAHMSDVTFHLSILRTLDETVKSGGNPVDFWYDTSPFGFALFRGYQHLPHLFLYGVYRAAGETIPLETLLRVSTCLLAVFMPWAFFIGARLLSFSTLAAGLTGLFSVLLVEVANYGLGLHNYDWGSGGIIAQLWATCFLVPAIGTAVRYLRGTGSLGIAVLLGFCTFGSHVVAIFVLGVSVALFSLTNIAVHFRNITAIRKNILRTALYFFCLMVVTTHQWFYTLIDKRYLLGSIHEPRWKFESYGVSWVLDNFTFGNLFDVGRFPGITALLLVGLVFCILRPQQFSVMFARAQATREDAVSQESFVTPWWLALTFFFSVSLYCGWEIWGWSVDLLGILRSLHWHRLVIGVHIFGLLLAGLGASLIITATKYRIVPTLLVIVLTVPLFRDRIAYYSNAKLWFTEALFAQAHDTDLPKLIDDLHHRLRGRVYTGSRNDWANDLKVGENLSLHNVTLGEEIPTHGILYYPMSLAGDVMFDVAISRVAQRQALGLRYVVMPPTLPVPTGMVQVADYGKYGLYADPKASMLDVVTVGFHVTGDQKDFPSMMRAWFRSQYVEQKIYGAMPGESSVDTIGSAIDAKTQMLPIVQAPQSPGEVTAESPWTPSSVSGSVTLTTPAYVLVKIPYHPNWQATVDGKDVRPIWVTPGFMAVPCDKGEHAVAFSYHGSTAKLIWFCFGIVACLALLRMKKLSALWQ